MNDELPEGWAVASTADLFTFVTSGSRGWAQYYAESGALFLRIANLDHDNIAIDLTEKKYVQPPPSAEGTRTRVKIGDLLVSITADVGMIGLVQRDLGEAYINQHIALARPAKGIDREYLAWYLTSREGQVQLRDLQRGATKVGLGLDDIRAIRLPLAPIEEQHRIVHKVEELFAKVDGCRARLATLPGILTRFRQAVLAAACEGRLTQDLTGSNWAAKNEVLLDEVASEIRTGPFGSALHRTDYIVGGIPVINPMNLVSGRVVPSPQVTVSESTFKRLENYALQEGDVILARRGEMGRCALIGSKEAGWLCGTGCAILRLGPEARPAFIELVISSPATRTFLREASVGTTMDNLNQKAFRSIPIFLPGTTEQDEVVCRVRALYRFADQIEARYEKARAHVDKLTQSILARAFRGELVMTEAALARREGRSYETAEQLLARIQNERAQPANGLARRVGPLNRVRRKKTFDRSGKRRS